MACRATTVTSPPNGNRPRAAGPLARAASERVWTGSTFAAPSSSPSEATVLQPMRRTRGRSTRLLGPRPGRCTGRLCGAARLQPTARSPRAGPSHCRATLQSHPRQMTRTFHVRPIFGAESASWYRLHCVGAKLASVVLSADLNRVTGRLATQTEHDVLGSAAPAIAGAD